MYHHAQVKTRIALALSLSAKSQASFLAAMTNIALLKLALRVDNPMGREASNSAKKGTGRGKFC